MSEHKIARAEKPNGRAEREAKAAADKRPEPTLYVFLTDEEFSALQPMVAFGLELSQTWEPVKGALEAEDGGMPAAHHELTLRAIHFVAPMIPLEQLRGEELKLEHRPAHAMPKQGRLGRPSKNLVDPNGKPLVS
jgi:hypothetical protein